MQPYFKIDGHTSHIIAELVSACKKLKINNAGFTYYQEEIDLYLTKKENGWELVIVSQAKAKRDIYTISDSGAINYKHSVG